MKILITGANGLLGQKLVHLIGSKASDDLVATSKGVKRFKSSENIRYRELDITIENSVDQVISEEQPDVIIHTAAMTNVDDCEILKEECNRINVEAVQNLVNAAEKTGAFMVHLSTDFIFNGKYGPLDEEAEPDPVNFYGESKLKSEKILQESSLDWAIARTVLVYGITAGMSRSNIILWVKESLANGKNIRVVNDQWRTPTLAEDLAMGCYLIASKKSKGIFNISGKDFLTPYDMALKTADFFGLDKELITETDSSEFKQAAERPLRTGFIIEKAVVELGYDPHSFDEGIEIVAQQLEAMNKN